MTEQIYPRKLLQNVEPHGRVTKKTKHGCKYPWTLQDISVSPLALVICLILSTDVERNEENIFLNLSKIVKVNGLSRILTQINETMHFLSSRG